MVISTRARSGTNRSGLGIRFYRPEGGEVACASLENSGTTFAACPDGYLFDPLLLKCVEGEIIF